MKRKFKFKNVVLFEEGEFFERLILFIIIWFCVVSGVNLIGDVDGRAIFGPEAQRLNAIGFLFVGMGYVALLFRPTPWPRLVRYLAGWFFLFHLMTAWSAGDLNGLPIDIILLGWALYSLSSKRAEVVENSPAEERPGPLMQDSSS